MTNRVRGVIGQEFQYPLSRGGGVALTRSIRTIANLRNVDGARNNIILVVGYFNYYDGGGGLYIRDQVDVSSPDNGGTCIVAVDGNRWKLSPGLYGVSICQFGAIAGSANDAAPAINNALVWASSVGAVLLAPAGVYTCNTPIDIWLEQFGDRETIFIGEGKNNTIFDFTGAPAGTDGVTIHGGRRVRSSGYSVRNARRVGIKVNPVVRGDPNYVSRISLEDIIADNSLSHGIELTQVYVGTFKNLESVNNGGYAFKLNGFHDALTFENCWAGGDAADPVGGNAGGWYINGVIYSTFENCAADWASTTPGYEIRNCGSVSFIGCGSESNAEEGFYVEASTVDSNNLPSAAQGIKGVQFINCFGTNNSLQSTNTFASFGIKCLNGINATVGMDGCGDLLTASSNVSLALSGTAGTVNFTEEESAFTGSRVYTGTKYATNRTMVGRSTTLTLSAPQSISNNVDSAVLFDTISANSLGATINFGRIVVPANVSRIKLTCGIYFETGTGYRSIAQYLQGVVPPPHGIGAMRIGNNNDIAFLNCSSAILAVVAGNEFGVTATQNSGGNLLIQNARNTFISMEVLG